jgi:hypothetical protein
MCRDHEQAVPVQQTACLEEPMAEGIELLKRENIQLYTETLALQ